MFVLDRARLTPYRDEPDRFDNRYLARLPNAQQLRALRATRALYVAPADGDEALDDLDATLASWRSDGIEVRLLGCDRFEPSPAPIPAPAPAAPQHHVPVHYYGPRFGPSLFWLHYPWFPDAARPQQPPPPMPRGASFAPVAHPSRTKSLLGGRIGTTLDPDPPPQSSSGGSWGRSRSRSSWG